MDRLQCERATMASTALAPTFLTAPRPKRMASPSGVKFSRTG